MQTATNLTLEAVVTPMEVQLVPGWAPAGAASCAFSQQYTTRFQNMHIQIYMCKLSLSIYIYTYTYMCIYIYANIYPYLSTNIYIYKYISRSLSLSLSFSLSLSVSLSHFPLLKELRVRSAQTFRVSLGFGLRIQELSATVSIQSLGSSGSTGTNQFQELLTGG